MIDSKGTLSLTTGIQESGIAWANFSIDYLVTGWNKLVVETNGSNVINPTTARYAAGYLEGYLTNTFIWDYYTNEIQDVFAGSSNSTYNKIMEFIEENYKWIVAQIQENAGDTYWDEVGLVFTQLQGILDGYNKVASVDKRLTMLQLLVANYDGDLIDLLYVFSPDAEKFFPKKSPITHCSSLIRLTSDDILVGHTTWDSYQTMTRIFKRYIFPSPNSEIIADETFFPSYPGCLSSLDDFYVLSSNLYVAETSIQNWNMSLYKLVTPQTIPSWARTVVANRMADSGNSWCKIYSQYNSGTYNNQWMIVDYNLFTPGSQNLAPNTVWVLEQIPGQTESADVSNVVSSQGYWASYNVPYFPFVYNIMETPAAVEAYGPEMGRNCSRYHIFKREAPKVENLADMQRMMQFNEWQTDPFSHGDPSCSIAARFDLSPDDPEAAGSLDSKITSASMMKTLSAMAICGPTHQDQTPFSWNTGNFGQLDHYGQPETFDFAWQTMDFRL